MEHHVKAQQYQRIRRRLTLIHLVLTPALLVIFLLSGLHLLFKDWAMAMSGSGDWLVIACYFTLFSLFFLVFDLPFSYYAGYRLEHQFALSNQTLSAWAGDLTKKSLLSFVLSLALVELLYLLIRVAPGTWWIWAWGAYAFVSYVLGKIFPVLIVPLFYKYGKVEDQALAERIKGLASRFGMPLQNVYSLNLSKTTKKANAAFMGIGKTRRVVLSDTLMVNFSHDEIEMVVAHELGHFKARDVWRLLGFGLIVSAVAFYAGFHGMNLWAQSFGIQSASDIAGLALLFLIFYGVSFVLMPAQNAYSRRREFAADRFALNACQAPDVFISCMQKLGTVNLAEENPPAWYERMFYDHPSLARRIRVGEQASIEKGGA